MKILVFFQDGIEDLEAISLITILKRANYIVDIVSNKNQIKSKYNINYNNLNLIDKIDYYKYDLLFIPGGGYVPSIELNNLIKYFAENKKYIAAICSAPTYIGKIGYLKGISYTCFPTLNDDFGGIYKDDEYVVYDNYIFTARSVSASFELAFLIVEILSGKESVLKLKKNMEYLTKGIK